MKVLMINGGPHKNGCTNAALSIIAEELGKNGVESEIVWLGTAPIRGCCGCGACKNNRCVFDDDVTNSVIAKAETADAFIFGSPVHYASASGTITAFLDRFFYAAGSLVYGKPGACIVSCRRGGASAALDQLNKYVAYASMPVISSNYWNMVHGVKAEDVYKDLEGVQTMRILGHNMAWLLKCIEAGKKAGLDGPVPEAKVRFNYVR